MNNDGWQIYFLLTNPIEMINIQKLVTDVTHTAFLAYSIWLRALKKKKKKKKKALCSFSYPPPSILGFLLPFPIFPSFTLHCPFFLASLFLSFSLSSPFPFFSSPLPSKIFRKPFQFQIFISILRFMTSTSISPSVHQIAT